jgi:signal transduction histidine kinase
MAADDVLPLAAREVSGLSAAHPPARRSQGVVVFVAVVSAAIAVWATVRADFLRYPGWLAVQKADLILGPVLVGLYWQRVRPASRFGWVLIAFGLLNVGYIAQSFTEARVFGVGLVWESLIYLGTQFLILTFPTGRLDGIAPKVVLAGSVVNAMLNVWLIAMLPYTGAGGAISQCRSICPKNGLAFAPDTERALHLLKVFEVTVIAVAAATALLLIWRFVRGTTPQRRALAIGTPVALFFLVCQITYLWLSRLDVRAPRLETDLQWAFTGARAAIWYGFLFALIAAQLFARSALRTLVVQSLRRPSRNKLEEMLREPLADPSLQLRFWDAKAGRWDGPTEPPPGSVVTFVDREATPSVALIHDAQLADDPELVQAAGAVALLAAENAELDKGWSHAVAELQRSRARIVQAVDSERHHLAIDLHDGVQQRLAALRLRLASAAIQTSDDPTRDRLLAAGRDLDEMIEEVRDITHQLYPRVLVERGLVAALERAIDPVHLEHNEIESHGADVDSAIYFCVLEAVQNARKHGGQEVTAQIREEKGSLTFTVADDGPGFDPSAVTDGIGLESMRERLSALHGSLSIVREIGRTIVQGSLPLDRR